MTTTATTVRIHRECSMGFHDACSDLPHSGDCQCPCHPLVNAVYEQLGTVAPSCDGRLLAAVRGGCEVTDTVYLTDADRVVGRLALSVRRPWANLIINGHKTVENRTWTTSCRGELVIHAGRAFDLAGVNLASWLSVPGHDTPGSCPAGYLGTVRLVDVHPARGDLCCAPWGEDTPGVHHWVLANPQPFPAPIDGRGRLGLYRVPPAAS